MSSLTGLPATVRGAFAEAIANPKAFWAQVGVMIANDLAWCAFWVLFFRRVGEVRGWDADRALLLLAIFATSAGVVLGVFANSRHIGRLLADGGLDAALALPVSPLPHLLVRRMSTVNLGDGLFGVVLFLATGDPDLERTAIFLVGALASSGLLLGFLVATGSLGFFAGRGEAGDMGFHAILLLSNYPADFFGGATKLLVYTALPAAFVSAVPARLVDDFDPGLAALELLAAAVALFAGWAIFTAGLRRYASGSVWTQA
ncbi:MAG TPA: ABC-2 family transporter protein [Acidimicrobiales bacterium]